jgi:hypothetical protein
MAQTATAAAQNAQNVVKLFQGEAMDWQATSGNTAITTGASTPVKASAGSDLRYYITGIEIFNNHATVATVMNILDNATAVWAANLPAVSGQVVVELTTPIKCSINTALNIQAITTGSNIYWNLRGYIGV